MKRRSRALVLSSLALLTLGGCADLRLGLFRPREAEPRRGMSAGDSLGHALYGNADTRAETRKRAAAAPAPSHGE